MPSSAELEAAGYTLEGLNEYAVQVEALANQFAQQAENAVALAEQWYVSDQAKAALLTDPTLLASYTSDYFTYVHPVQQPAPQYQSRAEFPAMPQQNGNEASDEWSLLDQLMVYNAPEAWKVVDAMNASGVIRGRQLVVENPYQG
jgi:hypothetical protein